MFFQSPDAVDAGHRWYCGDVHVFNIHFFVFFFVSIFSIFLFSDVEKMCRCVFVIVIVWQGVAVECCHFVFVSVLMTWWQ